MCTSIASVTMDVFELGPKTLGGACSKPPPRTSLPLRSRGGNQQVIWLLLGLGPGVCPTRGLIFHLPGMISDISTASGLSLTVVWTPRHSTADDDKRRQQCSMESATWIGVPWERASLSWSIWNGSIHCRVHVRSVAVGRVAWRHNVQSFLFKSRNCQPSAAKTRNLEDKNLSTTRDYFLKLFPMNTMKACGWVEV